LLKCKKKQIKYAIFNFIAYLCLTNTRRYVALAKYYLLKPRFPMQLKPFFDQLFWLQLPAFFSIGLYQKNVVVFNIRQYNPFLYEKRKVYL
jgi:hypothetical protein